MSQDGVVTTGGVRARRSGARRCAALLTAGVLLPLPALAGCGTGDDAPVSSAAARDIAATPPSGLRQGGTLRWAVDSVPATFNTYQSDADATTKRVVQGVLPSLFTLDESGQPRRNPDYLTSAKVTQRKPKQVVTYQIEPKAVWTDGRKVGAADFVAQWKALRGTDSDYWTARNAGYQRISTVRSSDGGHRVEVTFDKPYADWKALFSPLYPRGVTGSPKAFNDGARTSLKTTAGPFTIAGRDPKAGTVTLRRNRHWWGDRPRLDRVVFTAVPAGKRASALADDTIDMAEVTPETARRIGGQDRLSKANQARGAAGEEPNRGPGAAGPPRWGRQALAGSRAAAALDTADAVRSWIREHGPEEIRDATADDARRARENRAKQQAEDAALSKLTVHKALAPAYTQLALNGTNGPLADERVRRAVARAIDRQKLADTVLRPAGLRAKALGSHLVMAGQPGYQDNSGAMGKHDTQAAMALLADAGWRPGGGAETTDPERQQQEAGADTDERSGEIPPESATPRQPARGAERNGTPGEGQSGARGSGQAGAAPERAGIRSKDGQPLVLRFVLPAGADSEPLRAVGAQVTAMLKGVGVRTEVTKVPDDRYFTDHVAAGDYDLALYSWPATAFPASDGQPVYGKPEPAPDGSLLVDQNYTRVGTDQIDQLLDRASRELDGGKSRKLVQRADARIWAAAGSIPLYQPPQLVATQPELANAGAFGLSTPRYQDIGFRG